MSDIMMQRVKGGVGHIVLPGNGVEMEDVIIVRMK